MPSSIFIAIAEAATESGGLPAEAVAQAGGIGALGIDWRSLLFQVLNFAILLGLLRAFAFRPIIKILEERRRKIEESLKNAATVAAAKAAMEQERRTLLATARAEAERLVGQGKERGVVLVAAAEEKAQERSAQLLAQAEQRIANQVAAARAELSREAMQLVVAATEKVIEVKLDPAQDAELIRAAIKAAQLGEPRPAGREA